MVKCVRKIQRAIYGPQESPNISNSFIDDQRLSCLLKAPVLLGKKIIYIVEIDKGVYLILSP